jgi:hypothetical protein
MERRGPWHDEACPGGKLARACGGGRRRGRLVSSPSMTGDCLALPIPALPRGIPRAVWNDGVPFSAAPCRPLGTAGPGGDPIRHEVVKWRPATGRATTVVEQSVDPVSQPIDDIVALVPIFHISVSHAPSPCR